MPSIVATDGSRGLSRMAGLAQAKPPLRIATKAGTFWFGERTPDRGRVVENLDHDRFTGSPELQALTYAGLTRYRQQCNRLAVDLNVTIGLPLETLTGPESETASLAAGVRRWLVGGHTWTADGMPCEVAITEAKISSQPAGALFDFLLDETGGFIPARKLLFGKEIGVVSVGMSTVELLVASQFQKASRPVPCRPHRHDVEAEADRQQEFVVSRWIGRQADEIEQEEESRGDDVDPAIDGLRQNQ